MRSFPIPGRRLWLQTDSYGISGSHVLMQLLSSEERQASSARENPPSDVVPCLTGPSCLTHPWLQTNYKNMGDHCSMIGLDEEQANSASEVKSGLLLVFVNKVLL